MNSPQREEEKSVAANCIYIVPIVLSEFGLL